MFYGLRLDTNTVLYLEHKYQCTAIYERKANDLIRFVYHYHIQQWALEDNVGNYCGQKGLYGVSCLATINIDHSLVTALVESCCQKSTHSTYLLARYH